MNDFINTAAVSLAAGVLSSRSDDILVVNLCRSTTLSFDFETLSRKASPQFAIEVARKPAILGKSSTAVVVSRRAVALSRLCCCSITQRTRFPTLLASDQLLLKIKILNNRSRKPIRQELDINGKWVTYECFHSPAADRQWGPIYQRLATRDNLLKLHMQHGCDIKWPLRQHSMRQQLPIYCARYECEQVHCAEMIPRLTNSRAAMRRRRGILASWMQPAPMQPGPKSPSSLER